MINWNHSCISRNKSLVFSLVLQYGSSVPLNTSTLKYFWNLDRNIHKTGFLFICSPQLMPCCDTGWWAYNDSSPKYLIMINDSKLVFWVTHWYYFVIIICVYDSISFNVLIISSLFCMFLYVSFYCSFILLLSFYSII